MVVLLYGRYLSAGEIVYEVPECRTRRTDMNKAESEIEAAADLYEARSGAFTHFVVIQFGAADDSEKLPTTTTPICSKSRRGPTRHSASDNRIDFRLEETSRNGSLQSVCCVAIYCSLTQLCRCSDRIVFWPPGQSGDSIRLEHRNKCLAQTVVQTRPNRRDIVQRRGGNRRAEINRRELQRQQFRTTGWDRSDSGATRSTRTTSCVRSGDQKRSESSLLASNNNNEMTDWLND